MEIRHLELLRELAVRGTLAEVAAATYRTPSALSQQIRTAERDLGVKLVEPDGRRLRLTAAGQVLADGADEVCLAMAELRARMDRITGDPVGQVTIGSVPSAAEALLPGLYGRLKHTGITLDLADFDLAEADYAPRTLDVDIVIGHTLTGDVPLGADRLVTTVVAREPIDVALPADHPLAAHDVLSPADLVGTTWVSVPEGYPFDSILVALERLAGQRLERSARVRDNRVVESLVVAGLGLALLPRFTTRPRPGLVTRPLTGVRADRAVVAMCRPDRYARAAVKVTVDCFADVGGDLASPATA
ncbi:MAG TPA: LysR family transcriptional regulator [Propionibacteriaceae bacterium]|nr:LysR family transcriptional regulator [Propionibacteriaceae bacterium]